jgi:adenylate cyclase
LNQQLCKSCVNGIAKQKGGAEVPVSLLFADVRGSTVLAERMSAVEFSDSMNRFFHTVYEAVDSESGVIDHIVGDGVMAMWIPGFVGTSHPVRAVSAGRTLVSALVDAADLGESFPAGVGVHTGVAWVGVVGEPGSLDFTVLGDTPNTAARLGSAASGGELAMSDAIVSAADVATDGLERRTQDLKGKSEPVQAWIQAAPTGLPRHDNSSTYSASSHNASSAEGF